MGTVKEVKSKAELDSLMGGWVPPHGCGGGRHPLLGGVVRRVETAHGAALLPPLLRLPQCPLPPGANRPQQSRCSQQTIAAAD